MGCFTLTGKLAASLKEYLEEVIPPNKVAACLEELLASASRPLRK